MTENPIVYDPDELSPEERLARIIELLAIASVRLAQKEQNPPPTHQPKIAKTSHVYEAKSA